MWALFAFANAWNCSRAALPIEIGFGTHMGQGRSEARAVEAATAKLGSSLIRDEISWGSIETTKGIFALPQRLKSIDAFLTGSGSQSRAVLVLDYGNKNYDNGGRPLSSEARAGFIRYSTEIARRYRDRVSFLEIWNEWNHGTGMRDGSVGTASDYVALAREVVPAIRSSGSKARVLLGALADDYPDWGFARSLAQQGLLSWADGFSVHLYNYSMGSKATPEEMLGRLERLEQILRAENNGADFPIYVTEMGWPTHDGKGGTSPAIAGANIGRFLLEATRYPWLKGVWVYELFDGGRDRGEREQNFGLFDADGRPKAGTCNVTAAISLLDGAKFIAVGEKGPLSRWLQFERAGNTVFVAFSRNPDSRAKLETASGVVAAATSLCAFDPARLTNVAAGSEFVDVGDQPIVWSIRGVGVRAASIIR